jgi:autotransporter passenger strand-loop-strand repeat protein
VGGILVADPPVVSSGQTLQVLSGQMETGITLLSGGTLIVQPGGAVSGTINSGGLDLVLGSAAGTTVSSRGVEILISGGSASGTVVNSGGVELVLSGGVASGGFVEIGGVEFINGGTAFGTTVSNGGAEVVRRGIAHSTTVSSGGIEAIYNGGADASTTVRGGAEIVQGGTAYSTTVSSGIQAIYSGGTAISATVLRGGYEFVQSGGVDSAVTIGGGLFEVASGASTGRSPVTFAGGGTLQLDGSVSFGGVVAGFAVPDRLDLRDIAFGVGTMVSFTEANNGTSGTLTVMDGTHTANITLLGSYTPSQFSVSSDGNGGTAVTDPAPGQRLQVLSGQVENGAVLLSGSTLTVHSGGAANGTIDSGGKDIVFGTAAGTTVNNGGLEVVQSGGFAGGATIDGGGGGIVQSGGMETGATVLAGGYALVRSGGMDSAVTINGGLFEVASGGSTSSAPVTFDVGGTLQLDASVSFGGLVAGFAPLSPMVPPDRLDLRDIAFGSGTTVGFTEAHGGTSGTLTVSDGTHTANIELLGQYAASQFTAQSDGNGGTFISDPPGAPILVPPHQ